MSLLTKQIAVLEEKCNAFERMYREDLQRELSCNPNKVIYLKGLTSFSHIPFDVKNYFYPLSILLPDYMGLIFPFRKHILHSINLKWRPDHKDFLDILENLSNKRGYEDYRCEHHPLAGALDPTILEYIEKESSVKEASS